MVKNIMELHEKIKTLRKQASLSQQEFADKIDLHLSHITRLETGKSQPSIDALKRMATFFNVSTDYLLDNESENYEINIKNKSLAKTIQLIDNLDESDQEVIVRIIESFLTNKKVRELMDKKSIDQLAS